MIISAKNFELVKFTTRKEKQCRAFGEYTSIVSSIASSGKVSIFCNFFGRLIINIIKFKI